MTIVQILPALNEGGVERGAVDSNREYVRRGHTSIVISAGGRLAAQIEADGGCHILFDAASKNILTLPGRVIRLRALLRSLSPDVIHARSRVPAWLAWLADRTLKIPFVTTVHGFNSVNLYSRVMTFGDRVICVSGAIRDHVIRHYGIDESKTVVIPRGIDLDFFDPAATDPRFQAQFCRQFGLEGAFVVTAVGRITQLKDYETFILAIERVAATIPTVKGLIVGGVHPDREEYFDRLRALAETRGMGDRIVFAGHQSRVPDIYALSRIVVSASKKPESFGRSAAEALAMDRPVIATDHGGMTEIVIDAETGYRIPVGDADALAASIVRASQREWTGLRDFVAARFTLERMVDATLAVYDEVNRISVCHINLSSRYGGAEKNFVDVCNTLSERHFEVSAIVPCGTEYIDRFSSRVRVVELRTGGSRYDPRLWLAMSTVLHRLRPSIIHTHSIKATQLIVALRPAIPHFRHVATKHNDRKGKVFDAVEYPLAVSSVVAASIHRENVPVIYNGIDCRSIEPQRQPENFTILCVGRLDAIKQYDQVIDAVASLPFPCQLLIAGSGPQRDKLVQQVMRLGLGERVKLVGFVADVASLMASSHLVVVNSKSEGFSYTLIEGLCYAPLVISTPVGVAPDALSQELLFDSRNLASKLIDVYEHYEDYCVIAAHLREKAQTKFAIRTAVDELESFYRRIL